MNRWLALCLLACAALPGRADSDGLQRERALNRILLAERHEREREAAARGSGLMGIKPAATKAAEPASRKKPKQDQPQRPKRHPKGPAPAQGQAQAAAN